MKKKSQFALLLFLFLFLLFNTVGCALELKYQFHTGHQEDTELSLRPTLSVTKLRDGKPYTPEEILSNQQQTDDIVLVGVLLVLIIFIGTFFVLWRKGPEKKEHPVE
jgi:hypothetical protein